jgi:hypothetical protein
MGRVVIALNPPAPAAWGTHVGIRQHVLRQHILEQHVLHVSLGLQHTGEAQHVP